jgi:hypothetical protein
LKDYVKSGEDYIFRAYIKEKGKSGGISGLAVLTGFATSTKAKTLTVSSSTDYEGGMESDYLGFGDCSSYGKTSDKSNLPSGDVIDDYYKLCDGYGVKSYNGYDGRYNCDGEDDCVDYILDLKKPGSGPSSTGHVFSVPPPPAGPGPCYWMCSGTSWSTCDSSTKEKTRDLGCGKAGDADCCDLSKNTVSEILSKCSKCTPTPTGCSATPPPKAKASCLPEEKAFPFFSWFNVIAVLFLLAGYYVWRGRPSGNGKFRAKF